jgi:hypothetical protein
MSDKPQIISIPRGIDSHNNNSIIWIPPRPGDTRIEDAKYLVDKNGNLSQI